MRDFYTSIGLIYYRTNYPDNVIKKGLIKCCQKIAHIVKYETILKKYYKWCTISNKNAETVGLLYHNSLCEKYYFKKRYIGNIKKMQYENSKSNLTVHIYIEKLRSGILKHRSHFRCKIIHGHS